MAVRIMPSIKCRSALAVAVTLGGASATAEAATYDIALVQAAEYLSSAGGPFGLNIAASTATWSYDDITNVVTQTGGTLSHRYAPTIVPTLYRVLTTGLIVGNGAAASATSFVCAEGGWGAYVGVSFCGNYSFGENFLEESTATWGPGTAAARTLGGDDYEVSPQVSIARFDGMNTVSWNGTSLVLTNRTCTGNCDNYRGGFNGGELWTFAVVPLPPAAWLFGGALTLLSVVRRSARQ